MGGIYECARVDAEFEIFTSYLSRRRIVGSSIEGSWWEYHFDPSLDCYLFSNRARTNRVCRFKYHITWVSPKIRLLSWFVSICHTVIDYCFIGMTLINFKRKSCAWHPVVGYFDCIYRTRYIVGFSVTKYVMFIIPISLILVCVIEEINNLYGGSLSYYQVKISRSRINWRLWLKTVSIIVK